MTAPVRQRRTTTILLILLIIVGGCLLRLLALGKEGFWQDEVYSASFAELSILGTALAAFMLDVHPPLYYLQLNLWGRLGHGDVWLMLNSLCWSLGTLVAVLWATWREFGQRAALFALALCAVMGSEIYFANELRMYSMYSCLAVTGWGAANYLRRRWTLRAAAPLLVVLALIAPVHGGSFIAGSALLLYAFPSEHGQILRARRRIWIALALLALGAFLPWLLNASLHHVPHPVPVSLSAASHTVGGWLVGYGDALPKWTWTGAAVALVLGLSPAAWANPPLRRTLTCLVLWPLAFGALISLIRPFWLDKIFAFCAPFVAITLGVGIDALLRYAAGRTSRVRLLAAALPVAMLAALAWSGMLQASHPHKADHFRELARFLSDHVRAGDIIIAPSDSTFWGISRYLIGPDWGSILVVHDAALMQQKRWQLVSALLDEKRLERQRLVPLTQRLDGFRVPMFIGSAPQSELAAASGAWLISFDRETERDLPPCSNHLPPPLTSFGTRLRVYHVDCGGADSTVE
jgi:mannosyltransferase